MARIGKKTLAFGTSFALSFMVSLIAIAQTPPKNISTQSPNNSTQTVVPQPEPAPVNQDIPVPLVGQAQSVPLGNSAPMTVSSPDALEKAMGIEVPDILKPAPSQNTMPQSPAVLPPPKPSRPPTPQEIAKEIAPNFNVATDYNRLVQCYGTADFMAAFMRVRANRPGATPQIRAVASQIAGMKAQMQPFVLAASTVRTEARFRADYDRVARGISSQISRARNPDATIQSQLRTLDACSRDLNRWRGGR